MSKENPQDLSSKGCNSESTPWSLIKWDEEEYDQASLESMAESMTSSSDELNCSVITWGELPYYRRGAITPPPPPPLKSILKKSGHLPNTKHIQISEYPMEVLFQSDVDESEPVTPPSDITLGLEDYYDLYEKATVNKLTPYPGYRDYLVKNIIRLEEELYIDQQIEAWCWETRREAKFQLESPYEVCMRGHIVERANGGLDIGWL